MKDGRTRRIEESEAFPVDSFFEENQVSLVVAKGAAAGSDFPLERSRTLVGRGFEADLRFADDAMSSEHAVFELGDAGIRVRDLASTNGVRVNGAPVLSADLKHGDRIELGEHEFRFLQEPVSRGPRTFVLDD